MNIREATEKWVDGFDAIQQSMIAKLMEYEPDEWEEVTMPVIGDLAHIYDLVKYGEIIKSYKEDGERVYDIKLHDGSGIIYTGSADIFFIEHDTQLPMWGTMWSFSDSVDDYWLEHMDGIEKMSQCGFRIFESAEFGYFFGIDGAGYDFYESHWIPLYKARDLQWSSLISPEYTVEPETVGQFTEMYDNSGKEIYEGDILRSIPFPEVVGVVIKSHGCWVIKYNEEETADDYNLLYDVLRDYGYNVIGNIYDNPELLKEV